jgi:hypothetical protein
LSAAHDANRLHCASTEVPGVDSAGSEVPPSEPRAKALKSIELMHRFVQWH